MDKSYLEQKKAPPNCGNKEIHVLKNVISTSVATVFEVYEMTVPILPVSEVNNYINTVQFLAQTDHFGV